ncbi:lipopolysaccharide biosynthesis protein [Azospirillum sp. B2RO_4]|uniref:lipopolysaccharide biosynthesis protein n=1 Tax=Azospirillum sp. B2RO_4 TaxID=3027796 RepID=UPI003DA8139C
MSQPPPSPQPAGAPAGLRGRLISGTGALGITMVAWSVLQILAVPVFLAHWGSERYADWLAINALAGLLVLLELGINAHLGARMMVEAGRDDTSGVGRMLSVGLGLYAGVLVPGAGLVVLGWLAGLDAMLGLTAPDAGTATLVLSMATLLLVPRPILGSVLSAFGRFPLAVWLGGAQQLLGLAAQIAVVTAGGGLLAAAIAFLAVAILVGWVLPLAVIRRSHPAVGFRPRWPERGEVGRILFRSGLHSVTIATTPLLQHLPVLFLQRLMPDGLAVVLFTTMRTYAGALRQIVSQVVLSSAMEMTRQHHRGEESVLKRLFSLTGRVAGGAAGMLAGLLLVAGEPVFRVWTHGAIAFDPLLASVFLATCLLVVPGLLSSALLRLTDHADALVLASLLQAVLSVVLCLILIPWTGALGAGIAVAIAELAAVGGLALRRTCRIFHLHRAHLLPAILAGIGGAALAGGAAAGLFALTAPQTLVQLVVTGGIWTLLVGPPAVPLLLPRRLLAGLWPRLRSGVLSPLALLRRRGA